jgi:hypothetical protein
MACACCEAFQASVCARWQSAQAVLPTNVGKTAAGFCADLGGDGFGGSCEVHHAVAINTLAATATAAARLQRRWGAGCGAGAAAGGLRLLRLSFLDAKVRVRRA